MNQKRQPAGVPTGGEFAANSHDEAGELEYVPVSQSEINEMSEHAAVAALWVSSEVEEYESETGETVELGESAKKHLREEIDDFVEAHPELVQEAIDSGYSASDGTGFPGAFGHDFVLTRGRQGTGFWDRPELEANDLGQRLTDAVQRRGEDDNVFVEDGVGDFETSGWAASQKVKAAAALSSAISANSTKEESTKILRDANLYTSLSYSDRRRLDDMEA